MDTNSPDTSLKQSLKEERQKQWNSRRGQGRGWDRWRCSTFLEMIAAKIDRAIIAADKVANFVPHCKEDLPKKYAAYADYLDSLEDAENYLQKLRELSREITFVENQRMP